MIIRSQLDCPFSFMWTPHCNALSWLHLGPKIMNVVLDNSEAIISQEVAMDWMESVITAVQCFQSTSHLHQGAISGWDGSYGANKGIEDAGSTADIKMLWSAIVCLARSAIVCLGLGLL